MLRIDLDCRMTAIVISVYQEMLELSDAGMASITPCCCSEVESGSRGKAPNW